VHIDVDIVEWTDNQLIICPLDQTQLKQCRQIVIYPLRIALYTSRDLPYSDRLFAALKFTARFQRRSVSLPNSTAGDSQFNTSP
jgi:hypothetical protein